MLLEKLYSADRVDVRAVVSVVREIGAKCPRCMYSEYLILQDVCIALEQRSGCYSAVLDACESYTRNKDRIKEWKRTGVLDDHIVAGLMAAFAIMDSLEIPIQKRG
jgi:hypothetical protein